MKSILIFIALFSGLFYCVSDEITTYSERIYYFKVISFNCDYDIYCTKVQIGYYKYEVSIDDTTIYLTYEGKDFYTQCSFDENEFIDNNVIATNMWANNRGETLNMKKRYGPVIEKDRIRKNYPYGFGKN
jgi:hypothetical protein